MKCRPRLACALRIFGHNTLISIPNNVVAYYLHSLYKTLNYLEAAEYDKQVTFDLIKSTSRVLFIIRKIDYKRSMNLRLRLKPQEM